MARCPGLILTHKELYLACPQLIVDVDGNHVNVSENCVKYLELIWRYPELMLTCS